jgi:hypothetical protein
VPHESSYLATKSGTVVGTYAVMGLPVQPSHIHFTTVQLQNSTAKVFIFFGINMSFMFYVTN